MVQLILQYSFTQTKFGQDDFIILNNIRERKNIVVVVITDLGDGIINLEFLSKMNTIGGEYYKQNKAIFSRKEYQGL
jgi:3-hydroxyacyl-CoA dehydrogenase